MTDTDVALNTKLSETKLRLGIQGEDKQHLETMDSNTELSIADSLPPEESKNDMTPQECSENPSIEPSDHSITTNPSSDGDIRQSSQEVIKHTEQKEESTPATVRLSSRKRGSIDSHMRYEEAKYRQIDGGQVKKHVGFLHDFCNKINTNNS